MKRSGKPASTEAASDTGASSTNQRVRFEKGNSNESGNSKSKGKKALKKESNQASKTSDRDVTEQMEELEFEDPFEDEFDSSDDSDQEMDTETNVNTQYNAGSSNSNDAATATSESVNDAEVNNEEDEDDQTNVQVFRPGIDKLEKGQQLEYSSDAYVMYHALTPEWPALSIDIVPDRLGAGRTKFPLTAYFVAGTQADRPSKNSLQVLKVSELRKTKHDDDSESSDDDSDVDEDPVLETQKIPHEGSINRVRVMPQNPNIVSTWGDRGIVSLYDIRPQLATLDMGMTSGGFSGEQAPVAPATGRKEPVFTFKGHADEGFAMDWSKVSPGRLVTGDCKKFIYVWDALAGKPITTAGGVPPNSVATDQSNTATWNISKVPFSGHTASVEDLQWSPTEATVFASCSVDQTVKIWDTRDPSKSQISVKGANCHINVISWNTKIPYLLASGSDDGSFKIWDLRNFKEETPIAHFRYHNDPITSIEWDPQDENVIGVSAEDNTVTIWDMSLEEDTDAALSGKITSQNKPTEADVPPQLLFIHSGQRHIKELRFHKQLPGVVFSTAASGFNVFKPDVQI